MIPEIIRYKIAPAAADDFVAAYARAGEALKQSPDCHGFELLRSARDPELFLLTILWTSADAHMKGFRKSPQFAAFFAHIKPYVGNILEMEHYGAAGVSWRREA